MERQKNPERQRLGRLGALTVHARGRTNVGPARAAWETGLDVEFGIGDDLEPQERERRRRSAMKVRMTRLARQRWDRFRCALCGERLTGGAAFLERDGTFTHSNPAGDCRVRGLSGARVRELARAERP